MTKSYRGENEKNKMIHKIEQVRIITMGSTNNIDEKYRGSSLVSTNKCSVLEVHIPRKSARKHNKIM
jgi:hypothetical protein